MTTIASTTTMAKAIQSYYEPGFIEGVYRNDAVLNILTAAGMQTVNSPGGTAHNWHINTSGNTSVAIFNEGDASPQSVAQGWARPTLSYNYFWGYIQISGHARDALKDGGIFNAIEAEMSLAQRDLVDLRNTTYLSSSYGGLQAAISATTTYAGVTRGSASWFESSASTTATVPGLRALHRAIRDAEKGGSPQIHLVSPTVLEWYVALTGMPAAITSASNGNLKYNVPANTGAPSFDLGHNTTGHSFMGKPIVEVPDLTSTVWIMLDPFGVKHVIQRPFEVKYHHEEGDSSVYQISMASLLAVENPKNSGIMTSIS